MRRDVIRETWDGIVGWFESMVRKARRTTAGPVMVRLAVATTALLALLVATPGSFALSGAGLVAGVVIAFGAGVAPRSRWITVVALLTVIAWLLTTFVYGDLVLWRLLTVTAALYTMHTGAALAAVLPYDAIVSPGVLNRWLLRTGAVLGVSLAVGFMALVLSVRLQAVSPVVAPIVGVVAVAGLTLVLAYHLRRR